MVPPLLNQVVDRLTLTVDASIASHLSLNITCGAKGFNVDWGDGTIDKGLISDNGAEHDYLGTDVYTVILTSADGITGIIFSTGKIGIITANLNLPYLSNGVNVFQGLTGLTIVTGLSTLIALTNASGMFLGTGLVSVDLTDMTSTDFNANAMFGYNLLLETVIGLGSLSHVTNTPNMFTGCPKLVTIDVSGMISIDNADGMFSDCTLLEWCGMLRTDFITLVETTNGGSAVDCFIGCPTEVVPSAPSEDCILLTLNTDSSINYSYSFTPTTVEVYTIDWGDGAYDTVEGGVEATHEYTSDSGDMCVTITAIDTTGFVIGNKAGVYGVTMNCTKITDANNMFYSCTNLASADISGMTGLLNASQMFDGCSELSNMNFSGLNSITNASFMFKDCVLIESVSLGELSAITNTSCMFYGCTGLTSIDLIGVNTVTDASSMFFGCIALTNIDMYSLYSIENASNMFSSCSSLESIILPNPAALSNATSMFSGCEVLDNVDLSGLTSITNAYAMFSACSGLTTVYLNDLVNVENASYMFNGCTSLDTIDISAMVNITNASYMFADCSILSTQSVDGLRSVTNASWMFCNCHSLSGLDLSAMVSITNAIGMFSNCESLSSVDGMSSLTETTQASYMFSMSSYSNSLSVIDLSGMIKLSNAYGMFSRCSLTEVIGLNDLGEVHNATQMFYECSSLVSLDITGMIAITNATQMFMNCTFLEWCGMLRAEFITLVETTNSGITTNCFTGCATEVPPLDGMTLTIDANLTPDYGFTLSSIGEYSVNWGDGNVENFVSEASSTHNYVDTNSYSITITGFNITTLVIDDGKEGIITADVDLPCIVNATNMFSHCSSMVSANALNMSSLTNANSMFTNCSVLTNVDISGMVGVVITTVMFNSCYLLTSVVGLDTLASLTSLTGSWGMFYHCTSLVTIDISGMTALSNSGLMFNGCSLLEWCGISRADFHTLVTVTNGGNDDDCFTGCATEVQP